MGNSLSYVMLGIGLSSAMFSTSEATRREPNRRHQAEETRPFQWPNEKRGAVSLSFDDARVSQIDTGLALLDEHHVKVTFFVQAENISHRLEGWKKAAADGHEIGNHSMTHPCRATTPSTAQRPGGLQPADDGRPTRRRERGDSAPARRKTKDLCLSLRSKVRGKRS